MASRAESVQIGPFIGGLNTYSDNSSVADNEVVECINFELDLDGSLKSRPPFYDANIPLPLDTNGNIRVLGYYSQDYGTHYLIASDGKTKTYYLNGTTWTLITDSFAAAAMAQFDGKAWLLSPVGEASPGGYWTPSGFTADSDMAHGDSIAIYNSRIWISAGKLSSNPSRIYFSDILGQTPFWNNSVNFIDIGKGDGDYISVIISYRNSLVIFRSSDIYALAYSSSPDDAVASIIISGIGLSNRDSYTKYENFIYFMYEDRAYEFYNNRVEQINIKVPFFTTGTSGMFLEKSVSTFNNRIIFSYYDTLFVYSMNTKTWTKWKTTVWKSIGKIIEVPGTVNRGLTVSSQSIPAGSNRSVDILYIDDKFSSNAKEDMTCIMQTKNYDYQASSMYKRLFWWGINIVMKGQVTGTATPIVFNFSVTWGQLLAYTWGDLLEHTWGQPLSEISSIVKVIDLSGSGSIRKFIKFPKGLRFRQINFHLEFTSDGSTATSPVRLFSIMTRVRSKQIVSKEVT